MEAALNGLSSTVKHQPTKEAVTQAKEAVKSLASNEDVSIPYVREKCLAAFELAFDKGNDKAAHYAVEGVQILSALTGVAQWSTQLQCHCLTLLVEMVCSVEVRVSLQEVEECLELCMRVFGSTREEAVRVSARAAVSQSITTYCSNRYTAGEESQNFLSVYLDVTKLLESYIAKLDHLTVSSDQSVILDKVAGRDAANTAIAVDTIVPVRFLHAAHGMLAMRLSSREKLCPLMIRLLGVPDKNVQDTPVVSTEEPLGQGQMAKFTLSPAVVANPEATRVLYQILEQLVRIMAGIPSVNSILSDRCRLNDIVSSCVRSRSLSLWRMLIVCVGECAHPQYEIAIEAVRACGAMLQGILSYCETSDLMEEEIRWKLKEMFPTLEDVSQPVPMLPSAVLSLRDISETLKKLSRKFGLEQSEDDGEAPAMPITRRRTTEYDETTEKITAQKFVDSLVDNTSGWSKYKSTLELDEAILEFSSGFYNDFSAVHNEAFKSKSKIQQEFLNTDAIYIAAYETLCLAYRGKEALPWEVYRDSVLKSGCIVYVSESWLRKVYDHAVVASFGEIAGALLDVVKDYDGADHQVLTDVNRLRKISQGKPAAKPVEGMFHQLLSLILRNKLITIETNLIPERHKARQKIKDGVEYSIKGMQLLAAVALELERHKARQKIKDGVEYSIKGMQLLAAVALELELAQRCGWIFENLVESSCDVDELRQLAGSEEQELQKRVRVLAREDLLSMELVLDQAFVSIHAPECWKHVIRCSEFVWELEKFIYGALCYEKPSRFSFGKKKPATTPQRNEEEGISAADRTVESAVGNGELDKDSLNRALCILIAKISEILSPLGNRSLVHQMLIWPVVCNHFVKVASSVEESRFGVTALSEAITSLILTESQGLCFNQMLIAPFQVIVCSDTCTPETREQIVAALADLVKTKSDRIGSGKQQIVITIIIKINKIIVGK
ncbi:unnamed protein product [Nippostrongylus brasiliensis]|uniref:SEC7 domain-containing protein n=1 Tax=Nippostrongylus brasiliensis TaxID=27835 RepID=A0A158R234_NIPBR|nr:unnamed protein product [Nippostrongylus brasiliensis]